MDFQGLSQHNVYQLLSIINNSIPENDVLNDSLYDEAPIKNVISNRGMEEQLKTVSYSDGCCSNNSCPILHIDFDDDEEITVLPCNHGFNKEAITKWVSDEKAECPVCRFKLHSIEIKNATQPEEVINSPRPPRRANIIYTSDIFRSPSFLDHFNSIRNTVMYSHPYGPRIERVASIISEEDDNNDLMNAINAVHQLNSVVYPNVNSIYNSAVFDVIRPPDSQVDLSNNPRAPSLD